MKAILASAEHPGNSDVQAEVAGALWGLSVNDDIEEAIAAANGIKVRGMARGELGVGVGVGVGS